jgi:hypothetical protein
VLLFGIELATRALLDNIMGISEGRRLVEPRHESFSHKGGGSCVVPAYALVHSLRRATPSLWETHLHRVPEEAECLNKSLPMMT